MAEILSIVSTCSFVIAGISFVLALFFWFKFGIPSIIGDLSGRTARKSIAKMRESNEKISKKKAQLAVDDKNGKGASLKLDKQSVQDTSDVTDDLLGPETALLSENTANHVALPQTALLDDDATGLLKDQAEDDFESTAILTENMAGVALTMLDEVIYIHTDEVIEC